MKLRYEKGTLTIRSVPANYLVASMASNDAMIDTDVTGELIAKRFNKYEDLLKALEFLTIRAASYLDQSATHEGLENCLAIKNSRTIIDKCHDKQKK